MTTKIRNFFLVVLSATVFVNMFFLNATEVNASCMPSGGTFAIAKYEQGVFVDGFVIEDTHTGYGCNTRPVVSERGNLQSIFSIMSKNLNQTISSGVYQLSTKCPSDVWDEWCAKNTTLEQLSTDPAEFLRYKSEWQQKERDELNSITTQEWRVSAIIVAIVTFALLWPWILVGAWPSLRKRLSLVLIIAIILQVPLISILKKVFTISDWSYSSGQNAIYYSSIVLTWFIVGEIIFLIVRKIRSRSVTV